MRDRSAVPIRMGIRGVSVNRGLWDKRSPESIHHPSIPAWGFALLIAACGMLVSSRGPGGRHRGAVLVKDIRPGRSPSVTDIHCGDCEPPYNGGDLTDVRGILYFSANDGKHGYELWRSDGTARGTRMVKDINPGRGWSNICGITAVNRIIFFSADDGVHGAELWRSDGTARGTRMVRDIRAGSQGGPSISPTSAAPSTSAPSTAPIPGCGEATAPRRARLWSRRSAPRTSSGSTARSTSNGGGFFTEALAKRRHRGRNDHGQVALRQPLSSSTSTVTSSSPPATPLPGQPAVAKRRHRGRHDSGQGLRTRELRLLRRRQGTLYFGRLPGRSRPESSSGEVTAPRPARLSSSRIQGGLRACRRQGGTLYFSGARALWRSNGTPRGTTVLKGNRPGRPGPRVPHSRQEHALFHGRGQEAR